jgi:BirA family transcriptional regulator, biotin operon repressor / biotin---[acetyl-CoA-carboxylase] ligase
LKSITSTLFVGKFLNHYDILDSTNRLAYEIIHYNPPEGTIINTFNQTNGRGQLGNKWISDPYKNISTTIILYPKFLPIKEQFYLSMVVSLALADVMDTYIGTESQIKWPNDLYIRKKKIGGILIQNILSGENLSASIIGIGININQDTFEGLENASSFLLETNKIFELEDVLELVCKKVEQYYVKLKNGNYSEIKNMYIKKLLFYNQWHEFLGKSDVTFAGKIVDVQLDGKLVVFNGVENICFDLKEIKFL